MRFADTELHLEPGSFRDPSGGVVRIGKRVWRYFDDRGSREFKKFVASGALERLVRQDKVLPYTELGHTELAEVRAIVPRAECVIEQSLLPFISYAYEWPFEMLKDAALLHLDVLAELLKAGFVLKDGSANNIQFDGTHPTFIDLGSIESYAEGTAWAGYNQFCRMFLNPLILEAGAGIPYQRWLRSAPGGLSAEEVYRVLSWPARLRKKTFINVTLQTWLNRLFSSTRDTVHDLKSLPINKNTLIRQVQSLRRMIEDLRSTAKGTLWEAYRPSESYSSSAWQSKVNFVESQLSAVSPRVVWDCGCNTGEYSFRAVRHAELVIGLDADPVVINKLYVQARASKAKVLPLVLEITNPSPDQGWAQLEHYGLTRRGPADMVLWLGLLHHVTLADGVPPDLQVAWIAKLANRAILEFIPPTDPMARALSQWRLNGVEDYRYSREFTERILRKHFNSVEMIQLADSQRTLYSAAKL